MMGWKQKDQISLDEYIVSIRPKRIELSRTAIPVYDEDIIHSRRNNDDNGPEEAGCLVPA
ncbi:hypothetical protein [Salegentibacter echinorum]|nr:hypothetical protein [Salegentibacter echinorum]